jgi:hypothetical protein
MLEKSMSGKNVCIQLQGLVYNGRARAVALGVMELGKKPHDS